MYVVIAWLGDCFADDPVNVFYSGAEAHTFAAELNGLPADGVASYHVAELTVCDPPDEPPC